MDSIVDYKHSDLMYNQQRLEDRKHIQVCQQQNKYII